MAAKLEAYRSGAGRIPEEGASRARTAETSASDLDRLIHERTRLAIVSALAVNTCLAFNELKQLCARDGR